MFKKTTDPIETAYDEQLLHLLELARKEEGYTEDYKSIIAQATKLKELRTTDKIGKETWATIGANLAGIVIILSHERTHIIASKAFGLVKKIL
jgi:hypothetical protein